jgi:hypothetical protein
MRSLYLWLKAHPSYNPRNDPYLNEIAPYERHWIVMKWMSMQRPGRLGIQDKFVIVIASAIGVGGSVGANDNLNQHNTPIGPLPFRTGKKTSGRLKIGGQVEEITSGRSGPSSRQPADAPGMRTDMAVRDHVEAHAASLMRERSAMSGELWINNVNGPSEGCQKHLQHMLQENASLTVYWPDGTGGWKNQTYTGVSDSEWTGKP